jgi:fermentation-respiration switch protein FrsA (DUF1100 family)
MERLAAHHHPFPDVHISYPDAGHVLPAAAYEEAWDRAVPVLRAALSPEGPG